MGVSVSRARGTLHICREASEQDTKLATLVAEQLAQLPIQVSLPPLPSVHL